MPRHDQFPLIKIGGDSLVGFQAALEVWVCCCAERTQVTRLPSNVPRVCFHKWQHLPAVGMMYELSELNSVPWILPCHSCAQDHRLHRQIWPICATCTYVDPTHTTAALFHTNTHKPTCARHTGKQAVTLVRGGLWSGSQCWNDITAFPFSASKKQRVIIHNKGKWGSQELKTCVGEA